MFNSIIGSEITITTLLICLLSSLLIGLCISIIHMKTSSYSKNFVLTLTILPMLIQILMIMVNGDLGTSIAVLGAFSLIRFRSIPGNSREITSIFFAMAMGLVIGVGYILYAFLITFIISLILLILYKTNFGERKKQDRNLKILVPEDLDYTTIFDDIFDKYLDKYYIEKVKTTNLGSLYEITYSIILKKDVKEKEMIDDIRSRNGNLNIVLSRPLNGNEL